MSLHSMQNVGEAEEPTAPSTPTVVKDDMSFPELCETLKVYCGSFVFFSPRLGQSAADEVLHNQRSYREYRHTAESQHCQTFPCDDAALQPAHRQGCSYPPSSIIPCNPFILIYLRLFPYL